MKKSFLRITSIITALMVFTVMLAGCGGSNNAAETSSNSKGETTKQATESAAPEKKMEITFATWVYGPVDEGSVAELELEKKFTNVDMKFIPFERATFVEQINTRVASGEIPDIIYRYGNADLAEYAKQGILTEVPFDLIKKNAPNVYQASIEYGAEVWLATSINDKNYGIPLLRSLPTRAFTSGWRMDWLKNVGIDKVPETLEEMEIAFKKFVEEDPDKNGKKDTYATSTQGKGFTAAMFAPIFGAYGTFPNMWVLQEDGTVKHGITTPAARQALSLLQEWYKKGYIDPEFVTTDDAIFTQKWANGKIGYLDEQVWYMLTPFNVFGLPKYYQALKDVNPDAEIALAPAPKGPEGRYGYFNWGKITNALGFGSHLAKDQAKLEKCLQVVDVIMADQEIAGILRYGVEGEHWERDAQTNGVIAKAPYNEASQAGKLGTNMFTSITPIPEVENFYTLKNQSDYDKYARDTNVVDNKDYFTWLPLFIPTEVNQQASASTQVLSKYFINFISGASPMDDFDKFVKEWEAAGGAALTKAANEGFKNGQTKMDAIKTQMK